MSAPGLEGLLLPSGDTLLPPGDWIFWLLPLGDTLLPPGDWTFWLLLPSGDTLLPPGDWTFWLLLPSLGEWIWPPLLPSPGDWTSWPPSGGGTCSPPTPALSAPGLTGARLLPSTGVIMGPGLPQVPPGPHLPPPWSPYGRGLTRCEGRWHSSREGSFPLLLQA